MVTQFRTLLLLGLTIAAGASLSGCIVDSGGPSCPGVSADYQYFEVQWEVDPDNPDASFSCAQTPLSHVELTTNRGQLRVIEESCDDREFYNHFGATQSGLVTGTVVQRAQLISDTTGAVLSTSDVPPQAQYPIRACSPVRHTFEFPVLL